MATEFRLVNTGMGLTRSFLTLTRDLVDATLDTGVSLLDRVESQLPDIPLVSRPGEGAVPAAGRRLPGAMMKALPPGGYSQGASPGQVVFQDGVKTTVI